MIRRVKRYGKIVLFGSGELSSVGRKIHADVLKSAPFDKPVKFAILETPSGFEGNAICGWPEKMDTFFTTRLSEFKPDVIRIRALRNDGKLSTNNPKIVDGLLHSEYIYCGAGSPTYAVRHLRNSLALTHMHSALRMGSILCLGSASAIAAGTFVLPVYEIYKAGIDPYWDSGLSILSEYGLDCVIIPHWNNQEGRDFDTSRCYIGKQRFEAMLTQLPNKIPIIGIDEQTALIFDIQKRSLTASGKGSVHISTGTKTVRLHRETSLILDQI